MEKMICINHMSGVNDHYTNEQPTTKPSSGSHIYLIALGLQIKSLFVFCILKTTMTHMSAPQSEKHCFKLHFAYGFETQQFLLPHHLHRWSLQAGFTLASSCF